MSTDPNAGTATLTDKLTFTPLHRTTEVENIHAQVNQHEANRAEQTTPVNRKVLVKHMTVIGGGGDVDMDPNQRP